MEEDPIWRCMDSSKPLSREQLELVVQKEKINEIEGQTGCGKTSTLRYISHELNIPIKEYSELSDTTALSYDLAHSYGGGPDEEVHSNNSSFAIDRRKAQRFEHFVINNIRYETLYPVKYEHAQCAPDDDAATESDSDDGFDEDYSTISQHQKQQPLPKSIPPPVSAGVIIHVESPLTFARTQRIFLHSIQRILKILRDISKSLRRRVAIVFETLEGDGESFAFPTRVKQSLKVKVFKFNPIIKKNMKKLVESLIKPYSIVIETDTMEQLINDSDGDIRACLNTLQLICYRSPGTSNKFNNKSINYNSTLKSINNYNSMMPVQQVNKKQKLIHDRFIINKLNSSLMRDSTGSFGFFHVLGKIFYQKRLYPTKNSGYNSSGAKVVKYNSLERPYAREYNTEHLVDMIDVGPENLISWLHHHYYKFCIDSDIEKAALFLGNMSTVDTTSISSTQSTQFYEVRNSLDQLQVYLSIEATTFSLYEDQSKTDIPKPKQSDKQVKASDGSIRLIKSSVSSSISNGRNFYSFKKPTSMSLYKVVADYQKLLDCCTTKLIEAESMSMNYINVLLDYIPFLVRIRHSKDHSLLRDDEILSRMVDAIERFDVSTDLDYEATHEILQDLIDHSL